VELRPRPGGRSGAGDGPLALLSAHRHLPLLRARGGHLGRQSPSKLPGHPTEGTAASNSKATVRYGEHVAITFEGEAWEKLPGASRLTMAQRNAIEADDPLLCVMAGAGAGKTRVLTLRVARRVRDGSIEADRALVTTFSRKAAEELRTRLWSLGVSGVKAGTFHHTALGLLREHRAQRGRPEPQLLPDRRRLLSELVTGDPRRARTLDGEIGWAKARLVAPDHYVAEARRAKRRSGINAEQVADVFARYEAERTRRRVLDFDDLIIACADALAGDAAFADAVRWRTRHLFVDEMQDVNPAQFRLLTALLSDEPDLFVVGDPNQSVYGFNGADPSLLYRLPEILRGTKVIRLDENHRCTPQVVAVATAVLRDSETDETVLGEIDAATSSRVDGPVPTIIAHASDAEEAAWVARRAKQSRTPGMRWSSIAVLARTNAQLPAVQAALETANVPCLVAGSEAGPASDLRGAGSWRRRADPDDEAETQEVDHDKVVLTTFHRSKGLQWHTVIIIGLSAGLMPLASAHTQEAVDEERRLLYVALTRAEEELWCSWSESDDAGAASGTGRLRQPSPWLEPIARTIVQLTKAAAPTAASDVSARVAELRQRLEGGAAGGR
jgi:DNA helicase II / ATP-dependent DNA helicase PcrA